MNDNIKTVWNKAASSHVQENTSWATQQNFLTRFAELIIEECANIANKPTSFPHESYGEKMKQHFGFK